MTRVATALGAAILMFAPTAYAQASPEDRAAADALYEESGKLMEAGRFAEACPKLETSQRLDPGTGTLLRLGFCYERIGRTASAWSAYNEAEGRARRANDKRADDAAARAKALEPKLSRLSITVASPMPGMEVRRDGKPVDPGLWGTPVPVDPGEHVIEATAPGKQPWKMSVRIEQEQTSATAVPVPPLVAAVAGSKDDGRAAPAPPFWNGQRIAGTVVGGAGLVALGISLGLGAHAKSLYDQSLSHCLPSDPTKCYAQGVSLRNQAYSAGNEATPTFIGGSIAFAGGLLAFLLVPNAKPSTNTGARHLRFEPRVGARSGGVTLSGVW